MSTINYYKSREDSLDLVKKINAYWTNRGYPGYKAYVEPELIKLPNGRVERVFNIRSNIRQRCRP